MALWIPNILRRIVMLHYVFWSTLVLMSNVIPTVQPQIYQEHTIGVFAYVDDGIWKEWISLYNQDETEASYRIKQYFVQVIDKMNTHYASLGNYNLGVSVVLQRLEIATSSSSAPWSSDNQIESTGRDLLNANQAITDLSNEVLDNDDFQQYDHIIGFTGYDLFYDDLTETSRISIGRAEGLCSDDGKVSIVEDQMDYMSAIYASHEIAHNFGAEHDGDGNACSADGTFIMAEEVETAITLESEVSAGLYCEFSECTAGYIDTFISSLTDNCLLDVPQPYFTQEEVDQYLLDVPGQRQTLDEQCQAHLGPEASYCGELYGDELRCDILQCTPTVSDDCDDIPAVRVFDGTTCGNKKWCVKGVCVSNTRAPSLEDGCLYGDDQNGLCQRQDIGTLCYASNYRELCCDTCSALKQPLKPKCLYGDRLASCRRVIEPHHCYSEINSFLCCETSKEYEHLFRNAPRSCPFGDQVPPGVCQTRHCETSPDVCCGTCYYGQGYRSSLTSYPGLHRASSSSRSSIHTILILLILVVHTMCHSVQRTRH